MLAFRTSCQFACLRVHSRLTAFSRIAVCVVALLASVAGGKELDASTVLACKMDAQWEQLYDEIEGETFEEKSLNAYTTWEIKAISEHGLPAILIMDSSAGT